MTSTKRLLFSGLILVILSVLTMGLLSFFKKSPAQKKTIQIATDNPYKDSAINLIYNLLFCDNLDLFKSHTRQPYTYPYDVLFTATSSVVDLQKILDDPNADPRIKVLAYNRQRAIGHTPSKKEILAVIVEVGLDDGLDLLASFNDGTARYINQTGKLLVWETTTDAKANELTKDLFAKSEQIVNVIGTGNNPRRPHPTKGNSRITFLLSTGLSFGEASTDVLFNDPLASPALTSATQLMQYLTQRALEKSPKR